jgi:hypothetical protein
MTADGPPGRPYGLMQEARRVLAASTQPMLVEPQDASGEVRKPVPEIGGTSFAASLKEIVGGLRAEMASIKEDTASAVTEFREQVVAAREVPKRIRAETQVLRDGINELLGNQPPGGT